MSMEKQVYHLRREKIFQQMPDNSIALLTSAEIKYRNSDTEYPYRQDSHFYYLTGFDECESLAVLLKKKGQNHFILFCQDRDPQAEQWTGVRVGVNDALEIYGADEAYPIGEASKRMPELLAGTTIIYFLVNNSPEFDKKVFSWVKALGKKIRSGITTPRQFVDFRQIVDEARLIKSQDELQLMRKACSLSADAHVHAMKHCQVGMYEYELEAILLKEFYRHGSRFPAYSSIVATGDNACTLHYTRNDKMIKEKDLVLIDAGAEYHHYAADITRTFPANGKFTKEQQAIYELVLAAQQSAIQQIAPEVPWNKAQETILHILVQGLIDLKILKGSVATLLEEKAYLPFYMHNSGHWLGMDVHDVGEYRVQGNWRPLKPGMVFTVEPGLYISADNMSVAEQWRGIGVRIEDDIVVTEQGYEVLTEGVPKSVHEIEKLMKDRG
ncbi:MAG: Xaa-Pro aminopeptidase [Gammaproteobacteria bacterium 39-13]|nr:Xaa-Pro aminopeptidase [Gammaproteobacteria bacterium]OJV91069.1 MAG: Xaa-Pro aminopeptidase [Gammaproteobacteria bacterium 39-13]